jgi:hypothetical protein
LNIQKLDKKTVKKLSEIFDKYGRKEFPRLPQQYQLTQKDKSLRLSFDIEVLQALRISVNENEIIKLYELVLQSFKQWFGVDEASNNHLKTELIFPDT